MPGPYFTISAFLHLIIFYGNAYFLYPRLLNKKLWPLYILSILILLVASFGLKFRILHSWFPEAAANESINPFVFAPSIAIVIISIIYRGVIDSISREKEKKEKKAQQMAAELRFLRSQINPHFLFNTLTNVVSLARMKSNMTEPSLIKLSELLRYSLYESDKEKVLLDKEIEYLLNYIDLQRMRFGDNVSIELEITNNCPDFLIEPMLLISFIENAFKHGVGMLEHPFIQIRLNVNRESLLFTVVNNYNPLHLSKDSEGGIGLSNIRERLKLLYPRKHTLKIDDSKEIFKVELYIELS